MANNPVLASAVPTELVGPVEVGPVAHGGHCVARLDDGRVVFVRHALPGERVKLRITDASHAKYWLADAVRITKPAPERIEPRCPIARPGMCGGCDWQHTTPAFQRELKRRVVAEQLSRMAGIEWDGVVEDLGRPFGWRTRMRYAAEPDGRPAMRRHRSNDLIPLPEQGCAIAHPAAQPDPGRGRQLCVAAGSGRVVVTEGDRADDVTESAAGRAWRVPAEGFWQVHPEAADTLVGAVIAGLEPRSGEQAWDLYCGVGLFAGALVDAGCFVRGVEGSRAAIKRAERNVPQGRFAAGDDARVTSAWDDAPDLIVLDPPRTGARQALMADLCGRGARRIAYVACDPAALARDLRVALASGYTLGSLRAFDLFPQTHHVECVAILDRA